MTDKEFDNLIKEAGIIAINKMTEEDLKKLKQKLPFKISHKFKKQMRNFFKNLGKENVDNN